MPTSDRIRQAISLYRDTLEPVLREANTRPELAAAARMILQTYERSNRAGALLVEHITLTAKALSELNLTKEEVLKLLCPAFLGLYNPNAPVVWGGLELAIEADDQSTHPNILLECVYLPLLHQYRAPPELVAHIADKPDWRNKTTDFVHNPHMFYPEVKRSHYWNLVNDVMLRAKQLAGISGTTLIERSSRPAKRTVRGEQPKILSDFQKQLVADLRATARVMILVSTKGPKVVKAIAETFLDQPIAQLPQYGRSAAVQCINSADGQRRVILCLFPGGAAGVDGDYRQSIADHIHEFLGDNQAPGNEPDQDDAAD